jgi:tRNA pseudouridine55 synthase
MKRERLDIDGILLLDKPVGMTSNRALQEAKRLLNARKAGHTGSLDPLANGLLPLCFGEATKFSRFLLDADKRYLAVVKLGVSTSTYDADGEVSATRPVMVERAAIEQALAAFRGEIEQVPPSYSAIKIGGRRLYELARAGQEVVCPPRRVTIHSIEIADWQTPELTLDIRCSKGTYVRSLAHDLGEALGCGGHVARLRRLESAGFLVDQAVTLDALSALETPAQRAGLLLPGDRALDHLPEVTLTANAAFYLRQGQTVSAPHGHPAGWVRLYQQGHEFLGLGEVLDDGRVAPSRLVSQPMPTERLDRTKENG